MHTLRKSFSGFPEQLAQLVERASHERLVSGSNPLLLSVFRFVEKRVSIFFI
jgi:hypothetical protein